MFPFFMSGSMNFKLMDLDSCFVLAALFPSEIVASFNMLFWVI